MTPASATQTSWVPAEGERSEQVGAHKTGDRAKVPTAIPDDAAPWANWAVHPARPQGRFGAVRQSPAEWWESRT